MKKSIQILLLIMSTMFLSKITTGQNVFESFEGACISPGNAFFQGCFDDWISVSGSPDVQSNWSVLPPPGPRVTAFDGRKYVRFREGQVYTIRYALRWDQPPGSRTTMQTQIILTNRRGNQTGTHTGCHPGEVLPNIFSSDMIVNTHPMSGVQNTWQTFSVTFRARGNYSQLWVRPEMMLTIDRPNTESRGLVYFDAFGLQTCASTGYTTNFDLKAQSNFAGEVTVFASSVPYQNPSPVNHWWDVYYGDPITGSPAPNTPVPGNPLVCCNSLTAEFSNNLEVNVWYYIKHGIWNSCIPWRETRKAFRVQVRRLSSGEPQYYIEYKDVKFKPTEAYLAEMDEMASNLSPEEIRVNNQMQLNFDIKSESPLNSITNYPNPFNRTTTIEFNLEKEQPVSLKVYDLTGRIIAVLLNKETRSKGQNQVLFDGSNLSEGVYFYTIESNGYQETKRMILRK